MSCHPERKCPRYHQGWAFLLWFLLFPFSFLLQILFLYSLFSSFFFSSFPSSLFLQNMFPVRMSQRGILSIGCIRDTEGCVVSMLAMGVWYSTLSLCIVLDCSHEGVMVASHKEVALCRVCFSRGDKGVSG